MKLFIRAILSSSGCVGLSDVIVAFISARRRDCISGYSVRAYNAHVNVPAVVSWPLCHVSM